MPVDVIPHNRMGLLRNARYNWCTPIYSCSSSGNISLISEHGISKTVVCPNWSYDHSLHANSKFEPIIVPGQSSSASTTSTESGSKQIHGKSDYKVSKRTSLTGLSELASHTCYERVWSHCNWWEATEKCCIVQYCGNNILTCTKHDMFTLLHNKSDWSEQHFSMHMVTTRWLQCNLTVEGAICKTSWWFISLPCASLPSSTRNILHNILVLKFTQIQLVILLKKQLQIVPFFAHLPISRLLAGRHPGSSHRGRESDSVCLLESLQTPWRLSLRLHGS